jgi:hypothetical protein
MVTQTENARRVNEADSGGGITSLITGIINDGQDLIRQQLQMFLAEFKNDMRKTKAASLPLFIGAGLCHLALFILGIMLARVLNAAWPDTIPLWAGFGIVGAITLISGIVLVLVGKSKFDSFNPLPDRSVEALKENVEWQTKKT